jgi:hypothetical protein
VSQQQSSWWKRASSLCSKPSFSQQQLSQELQVLQQVGAGAQQLLQVSQQQSLWWKRASSFCRQLSFSQQLSQQLEQELPQLPQLPPQQLPVGAGAGAGAAATGSAPASQVAVISRNAAFTIILPWKCAWASGHGRCGRDSLRMDDHQPVPVRNPLGC